MKKREREKERERVDFTKSSAQKSNKQTPLVLFSNSCYHQKCPQLFFRPKNHKSLFIALKPTKTFKMFWGLCLIKFCDA